MLAGVATLTDSSIATSNLLRAKIYPDSDDATDPLGNGGDGDYDRVEYSYNRQSEVTGQKDQNDTIRVFDYDLLGRLIHDRVTTLGSGVDGAVRRISTEWDLLDRRAKVGSYSSATAGEGSPLDEAKFTYDGFGQVLEDWQAHDGAVSGGSPKVNYTYADGSDNTARRTSITTPSSGYVMNYLVRRFRQHR